MYKKKKKDARQETRKWLADRREARVMTLNQLFAKLADDGFYNKVAAKCGVPGRDDVRESK